MFKSIDKLEEKVTQLINNTDKQRVKSITSYEYITAAYYSIFN